MQMVKQAYMKAGLSDNQANIITAEVGRENAFDPNVLFGVHRDDHNKKTNLGMMSWQGTRGNQLYTRMKSKGLIGKDGKMYQSQEALDEMASFSVSEMRNNKAYSSTKKQFLDNPNVDYNTAKKVLGTNYIGWRYNDPEYSGGHKNRDQFYSQLTGKSVSSQANFSMPKSRYNPKDFEDSGRDYYAEAQATFHRNTAPTIESVYKDYQSGKLSPQQAKDFESDVRSGTIMLPQGTTLKSAKASSGATMLPQSVADDYANNKLTPQQRSDLESDIKSGLVKLPLATKFKSDLPDFDQTGTIMRQPTEQAILPHPKPEPTFAQKAQGVGEAALSLGTGATTGTLGMIGGTAQGLTQAILSGEFGSSQGAENIAKAAAQGMEAGTYVPKTETGQQYVQAIGEAAEPLAALTPATAELGMVAQSARAVQPMVSAGAERAAQVSQNVANRVAEVSKAAGTKVADAATGLAENIGLRDRQPQSGGRTDSMGAAAVPNEDVRKALATELPIPMERMTQGQITRDPDLLKQEVETSKTPAGAEYRQLQQEQHAIANMNLERFNEMTGSEKVDLGEIGQGIDKALRQEMEKDKAKVRSLYNAASKSEEANAVVDMTRPIEGVTENPTTLTDYLNNQVEGATETIIPTARKLAVHHGVAIEDIDGKLLPTTPTVKQMESFRKDIVAKTNPKEGADMRQASIIKSIVDKSTEPFEGKLYKNARMARTRQAKRWEENKIMTDLIGKKSGTQDRIVATENIVDRIVNKGSLADLRKVKRTLLTSGEDGKQSWKELQGAVIRDIQTAATKGIAPDADGKQMISPAALNSAIVNLDKTGKLNYLFGERGAEQLRTLNEVSKNIFTVPASAGINYSNTASAMQLVLDSLATSAFTGVPLPVATALKQATRHIKDAKIRKRVSNSIVKLQQPQQGGF